MEDIRKKLIEDDIKNNHGYVWFLHKLDKMGGIQAFDALMEQGTYNMLERAYDIAMKGRGYAEQLQEVREKLVEINPRWAFGDFKGSSKGEIKDPKGVKYVIDVISKEYGVYGRDLADFVEKTFS